MPFAWNQTAPPRIGQVDAWDVPLNKWLGVRFAHGSDYTLGQAVNDFTEDTIYDGPDKMSPELANKVWGIPGFLKFEEPVSIQRAALMRGRKELELERLAYLEGASHKWYSFKGVAGFAAGVVGGFSHPLDAATAFIPFVGSEAKAAALAKMGGGTLRQALARGIFTEESLKFGRLTTAMVDGVLSQAFVELPVAFEKARNQAEYTAEESAINILGGGVFAGGIHLTARGISALWKRAGEMHSRLNPETRDALFREQERAFVEGDKPATARIIHVDEEAIRSKVMQDIGAFDEAGARAAVDVRRQQALKLLRQEGLSQANAEAVLSGKKLPKDAVAEDLKSAGYAYDPQGGPSARGQGHDEAFKAALDNATIRIGAIAETLSQPLSMARGTAARIAYELAEGRSGEKADISEVHSTANIKRIAERYGVPEEAVMAIRDLVIARAKQLDPLGTSLRQIDFHREAAQDIADGFQDDLLYAAIQRSEIERQARMSELVDAKRAEHEAKMAGRIDAERTNEIAHQQAEGKILPPEEIKKYAASQVPKAAEITAVKEDIATLEAELKQRALTPEEQASVAAELKAIDDEVYTDQVKQIRAAVPCVKNAK